MLRVYVNLSMHVNSRRLYLLGMAKETRNCLSAPSVRVEMT